MNTLTLRDAHGDSGFQYYHYQPSMAAAVLFVVLFTLVTAGHFFRMIRSRTWMMIPFVIGGIFEITGYVARAVSASQNPGPYTLLPFIIQSLVILVAPALFAASLYMELGRIVLMVDGESALFIRRTWLTTIFVCGDITSFLVQAGGAALLSFNSATDAKIGKYVVCAGLAIQIVYFGCFVFAASLFQWRLQKRPNELAYQRPWRKHLVGLYIVSMLIFVRSIVRLVEYVQGYSGYIETHEVFLYCFDAAIMFIASVVVLIIHPAEVAGYVRELKAKGAKEGAGSALQKSEV